MCAVPRQPHASPHSVSRPGTVLWGVWSFQEVEPRWRKWVAGWRVAAQHHSCFWASCRGESKAHHHLPPPEWPAAPAPMMMYCLPGTWEPDETCPSRCCFNQVTRGNNSCPSQSERPSLLALSRTNPFLRPSLQDSVSHNSGHQLWSVVKKMNG